MAEKPIANRTILAVFPVRDDRTTLMHIFGGSTWKLLFTCTLRKTQTALSVLPGVVISGVRLSDGHGWSDLLREMKTMDCPPPLIVSDRLADERLWAEVLNLGGYDLLVQPFDAKEVHHAVSTACRRTEHVKAIARLRNRATTANTGALPGIKVRTAFVGSEAASAREETTKGD